MRRPWRAIALWLGFVVVALAAMAATGTESLQNGAVGESARGYDLINQHHAWGTPREYGYLHSDRLLATDPAFRAATADVENRMGTLLAGNVDVQTSRDRHAVLVVGKVIVPVSIDAMHASVLAAGAAHPQVTIEETGDISASDARDRTVNRDLHRAELLSIPVTLIVLLFAFGAIVAALVPLLLALTAVAAAFGLLGPISQVFPLDDSDEDRRRPDRDGSRRRLRALLRHPLARGAPPRSTAARGARAHRTDVRAHGDRLGHDGRDRHGRHVRRRRGRLQRDRQRDDRGRRVRRHRVGHRAARPCSSCSARASTAAASRFCRTFTRSSSRSRFWPAVIDRVLRRPVLSSVLSAGLLLALAVPALSLHLSDAEQRVTLVAGRSHAGDARPRPRRVPRDVGAGSTRRRRPRGRARRRCACARTARDDSPLTRGLVHPPFTANAGSDGTSAEVDLPLTGSGDNAQSRRAIHVLRDELVPPTLGKRARRRDGRDRRDRRGRRLHASDEARDSLRDRVRAVVRVRAPARGVPLDRRAAEGDRPEPALRRRGVRACSSSCSSTVGRSRFSASRPTARSSRGCRCSCSSSSSGSRWTTTCSSSAACARTWTAACERTTRSATGSPRRRAS